MSAGYRCEGSARYGRRCWNFTRHPTRLCNHHRDQENRTRVHDFLSGGEHYTVILRRTPTRWRAELLRLSKPSGGFWIREQRRYVADLPAALALRTEWVTAVRSRSS